MFLNLCKVIWNTACILHQLNSKQKTPYQQTSYYNVEGTREAFLMNEHAYISSLLSNINNWFSVSSGEESRSKQSLKLIHKLLLRS